MNEIIDQPINDDFEDEFILDPQKPLVLLLGWVDHEGVLSLLKSAKRQYKKKLLESKPDNWEKIRVIFNDFKVTSVLAKISPLAIKILDDKEYSEIRESLFDTLVTVPNRFFLYEDLLKGLQDDRFREEYRPYPSEEVINRVISWLKSKGAELVPYKKNAEVTVLAQAFLEDTERNLIFRLYVPSGKLWANEADRFLALFRDYLQKIDHVSVRLDQKRTDFGVIYEFHGETPKSGTSFNEELDSFSHLMDLCINDTNAASLFLGSKSLNESEIASIITRYSKEARRLQIDIKHEAESKYLSIRQRLEAELFELAPTSDEWNNIELFLNSIIPVSGSSFLKPLVYKPSGDARNITLNIRPQFVQAVNNITAQEIHGNQHFLTEEQQLLDIVKKYGADKLPELETAVYEVADKSSKQVDKLKASKMLKGFLIEVGKKTGDVAISILQKFIEKQLGM